MAENNPYANIGTLSPDQFQQQQELTRQQRMAEMLSQNNQQPQGQMIGNRFVAPSWAAQLAPAVNMIAGAYLGKKADENALAYAKQLRAGEESAMADYLKELQGKPAVPASSVQPTIAGKPMRDDETGALYPPIVTQGTPAMPANPQKAHANAALNYNLPAFARQNAMTQLFAQPKEFDLSEGSKRYKEMPDGTIKEVASGGEKLHPVGKNLVTSSGKVVYSAPLTGEEKVNPQEAGLRSSFFTQAQPHIAVSQAYRKIESAPETAAGDLSLIYGFMKILDSGSAVKEGEFANADNARGVPETIRAQYNKVVNGQRLAPRQRTEFIQSAGDLVKSQQTQFNTQKDYYANIAGRYKIDPQNIIYDPYADLKLQTTPPKQPKTKVNVGQQLNIPQTNIINQADAIISGGK